jgi:hypothetical protein
VNQLIGCVRSRNGPWERPLVEAIALDNLDARSDTLLQKFRVSDKTTNAIPGLLQCRKETPSDVASGSSQQDQRAPTGIKMRTAMSESTVNHLFRARNGKRRVLTLYPRNQNSRTSSFQIVGIHEIFGSGRCWQGSDNAIPALRYAACISRCLRRRLHPAFRADIIRITEYSR